MNGTQLLNFHGENLAENQVFSGFWELHRAAVTVLMVLGATQKEKSGSQTPRYEPIDTKDTVTTKDRKNLTVQSKDP